MIEVRKVSYKAVMDAMKLSDYAEECSPPEMGEIKPGVDQYEALEENETLHTFGAYEDGEMIGFAAVMVYIDPQYSRQVATTASLYVTPSRRTTPAGLMLIRTIEYFAKANECHAFTYSAPLGSQLDKLLQSRAGSKHSHNLYTVML